MTKEVSGSAVERFVRDEIPGAYSFFRKNLKEENLPSGSLRRFLRLSWLLFILFLEKLTPMRRLLFAVALGLFAYGWLNGTGDPHLPSFVILLLLLALEVADKLLTKSELSIAREIQMTLLPPELVAPEGFEAAAYTEVANSVGGDYYDTIRTPKKTVVCALADVSGKGISAALYTTTVQTALRLFAAGTDDPSKLLHQIDAFMQGRMKKMYFLTMVLAVVDAHGSARISRAGHPRPILVSRRKKEVVSIDVPGVAIGMGSLENQKGKRKSLMAYGVARCTIDPGDLLVLVSDGVLETTNPGGEEYGEQRLKALLREFGEEPVEATRDRIVADLTEFRRGQELRDDSTFLILRRVR